jgi:hypothetical protein
MARRLDHAVEGHELDDNQLPHSDLSKGCGIVDQERVKNALKAGARASAATLWGCPARGWRSAV